MTPEDTTRPARRYAPVEPLHRAPGGPHVLPGQREEALSDALRGVELGAYDEQICAWMVRFLDDPTLRTIVSLLERVRGAEEPAGRSQPTPPFPLAEGDRVELTVPATVYALPDPESDPTEPDYVWAFDIEGQQQLVPLSQDEVIARVRKEPRP